MFTAATAERPGLETGDVVAFLTDQVGVRASSYCTVPALSPIFCQYVQQGCLECAHRQVAAEQALEGHEGGIAGLTSAALTQDGVFVVVLEDADEREAAQRHYGFQAIAPPAATGDRASHLEVVRHVRPTVVLLKIFQSN